MFSFDTRLMKRPRRRFWFLSFASVVFLGYCSGLSIGADQAEAKKQYEALCARYKAENERAWARLKSLTDTEERVRVFEQLHPASSMKSEFLEFEAANRGTLLGLSALHHLVSVAGSNGFAQQFSASETGRKAMDVLAEHYVDSPDLDVCFESIAGGGESAKSLLRRAMTSSVQHVRGAAFLKLAEIYAAEARIPPQQDAILELLSTDAKR